MCGENGAADVILFVDVGSPPHVRGKLCVSSAMMVPPGITPACAGKTSTTPLLPLAH